MKKFLLIPVVLLVAFAANAQFSNSWIDYNKTYYKFKIFKDGLYRINKATLTAAGLGNTPAENFQLWRNGKEISIYTSIAQGIFNANDFIEFWGEMNDGKTDKTLYRNTAHQLNDKYSLESDTSTYFLTANVGANLRFAPSPNPVQGNVLPVENYFMRKVEMNYKNRLNLGFASVVGEYVYSSSYDVGEGWASNDVAPNAALVNNFTGLNVYAAGPPNSVMLTVGASGNAPNARDLVVKFFNNVVHQTPMAFFNYRKDTVKNLALNLLQNNDNLPVSVNGNSNIATDRIAVAAVSVTYPATFNFNNQPNFYFELGANGAGNYLEITNFNNNNIAPVLLDFTNNKKYLGDIAVPGKVRFVLPPSADVVRRFRLVSQDAANIANVNGLTPKSFINYGDVANQGDYLIISNSALYNDGNNTNQVDLYRQYRSSAQGGNYNAKVVDIDELKDQFGYGIKNHPIAIRDFIRYAKQNFNATPQYIFIIGRGLSYIDYKKNEANPIVDKLDLVPSFGWPASDVSLACNPGEYVPLISIGRLGAINGTEVGNYLEKMKEYEAAQQNTTQTLAEKAWMKNFITISGGKDDAETADFVNYLNTYKNIVQDTFYGAHVEGFAKSSIAAIEQKGNARITQLFNEGLGFIQYFGHSSGQVFAFNLNEPNDFSNAGKYPFFSVSGCTAGNFYVFDAARLNGNMTLSEKYSLAHQRGSIGFLSSTHFGIPPYLNLYNTNLYNNISKTMYGNTIGNQIRQVLKTLGNNPQTVDYYVRIHLEEMNLQGDPAIKINFSGKPDYVVEDQTVKIDPNPISIAENKFSIAIKMYNIGKATSDSIRVTVKQQLPNNEIRVLYDEKRLSMPYIDSVNLVAAINPLTDKGINKLIVTLDDGNLVDELSEMNNVLEKEFYIFEDELRPIYPYDYSIINQQNITFSASTANPLAGQRDYVMEMDTTTLFNSPVKKTYNATGTGGLIQFKAANVTYADSTVYYWRVAVVPINNEDYVWNTSSFIYLQSGTTGFNQSHYYQFKKNDYQNILLNTNRHFEYSPKQVGFTVHTGIYPFSGQTYDYALENGGFIEQAGFYAPLANNSNVLRFYIIDSITLKAWKNIDQGPTGQYGSYKPTPINATVLPGFFQFNMSTLAARQTIMDFLDLIPSGNYIAMTNTPGNICNYFPTDWQKDTLILGHDISLYHKLRSFGFTYIDSLKTHLPFIFVTKKGTNQPVSQVFGLNQTDKVVAQFVVQGIELNGAITSDKFGPAKSWQELHWRGNSVENPTNDSVAIDVIGVQLNGITNKLATVRPATDTTLDWVDANLYPYLKLKMINVDSVTGSPHQLKYWQLNATYLPEGAVAPNILFNMKDTVDQGELINFRLAFKNVSPIDFDSMKINFIITDRNNVPKPLAIPKQKALISGDTLIVSYQIDTKEFPGTNTLFVDVNPNNDQPEQYHFNNILYKEFYVRPDNFNPLLDVTFDGVHILNKDIVAAAPHILVKLKDESKFLALNDTALLKVQIRYPDGTLHNYQFGDTMHFTPANLNAGENAASIDFTPYFAEDGEYELIVSGKDVIGNTAGALEYRVIFTVISKPMISNLLNYPNPFTSSTAFVFTITGKEVPQNIRIQILTITGKVVKEITKNDLGSLHIGRNITEYKWDGTDMYGQKLGNGVYLYRVLTNLNGKSLDKYRADGDETDKYFNKGYGKMVLIR